MATYDLWADYTGDLPFLQEDYVWDEAIEYTEALEWQWDSRESVVIFPSGRAGLYSVLELLNMKRYHHIGISEWSSHCVIECIGRLAMPIASGFSNCQGLVFYHQWGWTKTLKSSYDGHIIEDSCDSIITDEKALFANGGEFELFSLKKVLNSAFGGVIFCQKAEDAQRLREIRKSRSLSLALRQYNLKMASYKNDDHTDMAYWGNLDSINGFLPLPALKEIASLSEGFKDTIRLRKSRIERFYRFFPQEIQSGRLPAVIPIPYDGQIADEISHEGIGIPVRHFDFAGFADVPRYEKCIAIPLHGQVSDKDIDTIIEILERH